MDNPQTDSQGQPLRDALYHVRYGREWCVRMYLSGNWYGAWTETGKPSGAVFNIPSEIGDPIPPQGSYSEGWRWAWWKEYGWSVVLQQNEKGWNKFTDQPLTHQPEKWGPPAVNPGLDEEWKRIEMEDKENV